MIDLDVVLTKNGADEVVQYLCGLIDDGYISHFKLGEGGWNESAVYAVNVGSTSAGTLTYNFELYVRPVIPSSFSVTNGTDTLTDNGSGVLTGNGSGTIDYKSGEVVVIFDTDVGVADIDAAYKYRGELSETKTERIGTGDGTNKLFDGVLRFHTFGVPIAENSISITDNQLPIPQALTDDGNGNLTGDGTGTIDYITGDISFEFTSAVPDSLYVDVDYKYHGAPKAPDNTKTDLESESDPNLFTISKDFTSDYIASLGTGTGKVSYNVFLDLFEGIDDGTGESPYFFEGGLFSANDVMVCYFTFTKVQKTGSDTVDLNVVSVI